MFAGINGLLIPGGAVSIHSSPYAEASNFLFDLAKGSFKTKVWRSQMGKEKFLINDKGLGAKNKTQYFFHNSVPGGFGGSNYFLLFLKLPQDGQRCRGRFPYMGNLPGLRDVGTDGQWECSQSEELQLIWPAACSGLSWRSKPEQTVWPGNVVFVSSCSPLEDVQAPAEIVADLSELPVTINFHHWCLTMENFTLSVSTGCL